eukprot:11168688-Ditylum_brightwellii.AAC.1
MQQVDAMLKVASTKEDSTWSDITKIPVGTAFEEAFQLQQVTFAKDSNITALMKINTAKKWNEIMH